MLDIGYKIMASIMDNRLRNWLEKNRHWKGSQAGFRAGRSTRDHIFTLSCLIGRKLKQKGGKLYIRLIDFKTASDVIDREILIG